MSGVVRVEALEPGIVEVRIDDPEGRNRLSDAVCDGLMDALAGLRGDPALRVVLLAGRPDVFCAGAPLETLHRLSEGAVDVKDLHLSERILEFPVPVVGALEGHAVGGGLMVALCCDLLVAAEGARYGVNFVELGFTPGMGTTRLLPALAGPFLAAEMILTGALFRGRDLRGRGLFNHVVPAGEVRGAALDLALRMADKPRHVLEMLKLTLALPRRRALQEAMATEHLMHQVCFGREDTRAAVEAAYLRS